jgi:hypothetical protein
MYEVHTDSSWQMNKMDERIEVKKSLSTKEATSSLFLCLAISFIPNKAIDIQSQFDVDRLTDNYNCIDPALV